MDRTPGRECIQATFDIREVHDASRRGIVAIAGVEGVEARETCLSGETSVGYAAESAAGSCEGGAPVRRLNAGRLPYVKPRHAHSTGPK